MCVHVHRGEGWRKGASLIPISNKQMMQTHNNVCVYMCVSCRNLLMCLAVWCEQTAVLHCVKHQHNDIATC